MNKTYKTYRANRIYKTYRIIKEMTKKERYARFMAYFQVAMPEANTELHYNNPFQLLCAVMLSAQCTDKRVNMVTPALFEAFPTPEVMRKCCTM